MRVAGVRPKKFMKLLILNTKEKNRKIGGDMIRVFVSNFSFLEISFCCFQKRRDLSTIAFFRSEPMMYI